MERQQSAAATAKGHARNISSDERRRVAMPRRSTKGPLDAPETQASATRADDPLQLPLSQQPQPQQIPIPPTNSAREGPAKSVTFDFPEKDFSFLLRPEIYHPLSYLDTPQPFRSPALQPPTDTPIPTLLSTGHFRDASILSAQQLANTSPPPPASQIFSLLFARLASLTLTNNTALAAQEAKVLSDLSSPFYLSPSTDSHIVPWDLRLLAVRLQSLGHGDWRRGIAAYYELARETRIEMVRSKERALWKGRLKDLGVRVANALVEMGDLEAAARHLHTLRARTEGTSIVESQREALVWLRLGDIPGARRCLESAKEEDPEGETDHVLEALCEMSDGQYAEAVEKWRSSLEKAPKTSPGGTEMIQQNLAVCLLYTGQIEQARGLFDSLLSAASDVEPFPALTFNLCTIYELCSEKSRALKTKLAERIASKTADARGLDRDESEIPVSEDWRRWTEMTNADFKL